MYFKENVIPNLLRKNEREGESENHLNLVTKIECFYTYTIVTEVRPACHYVAT